MKTEAKARECWCPYTAGPGMHRRGGADQGKVFEDCRCIASACMAWRWYEVAKPKRDAVEIAQDGSTKQVVLPATEGTGYCGLAGRV